MIIQSKRVYFEEKFVPKQIEIKNDKIVAIHPYGMFKVNEDYGDKMILPGLCDVHNHGYAGTNCADQTKKTIKKWTEYMPSEGVTSFVAGISCHEKTSMFKSMKNIGEYIEEKHSGAKILGIYEEGPFISLGKERGAQNPAYAIIPKKKDIDEFRKACNDHLIYVMIAPEMLNGKYDVIDYCSKLNIPVALGHTGASFDICADAISHGAISFTHTFNGMKGLHHREPGVVGAAMYFDETYCELISDGVHVDNRVANILAKVKGKDKLLIITDSIEMKGFKKGEYKIAGQDECIKICDDGICRLPNGTLCGSVRSLNQNLYNAIFGAKIDTVTAINACTINPMRLLHINDRGLIKQGYKADIAVFDDNFNTQATYVEGKLAYKK